MKSTVSSFTLIAVVSALLFSACSKNEGGIQVPQDDVVRFVVVSDLHYMHPDILVGEGKAFDEYNAEECKLLRESGAILNEMIHHIKAANPSFVIVCGDMTKDGEVICHEYVARVFNKLTEETGIKVLVVPGNHDMNNPHSLYYDGDVTTPAPSATEKMFEYIYAGCGYGDAVERRGNGLDYMAYPADGIAFIGVDSNKKNTEEELLTEGGLSREQVEWIQEMVRKAHGEKRYVLMSMHHNPVDFYDNAQILRGANIANAKNGEYDNDSLIDDLCAAGVDVVFSGHSHMHSITRAWKGPNPVYSIVTGSLVNLPLAYRIGTIDSDGKMSIVSGSLKKSRIPECEDLESEGDRYWHNLTDYYLGTAADKAWCAAGLILRTALGFRNRDDLHNFLEQRFGNVFYTFLTCTSEGNEHLSNSQKNYEEAKAALDGLMDFLNEKDVAEPLDIASHLIFGESLDDFHKDFDNLFKSAYFNYLGNDYVLPDDAVEIQLHR